MLTFFTASANISLEPFLNQSILSFIVIQPHQPWSSLVEGDEGCMGPSGKLLRVLLSSCMATFLLV